VIEATGRHAGGRPPKGELRRDVRVTVHFTSDEATRLKRKADVRGLTVSAYMRQYVLAALENDTLTTP